MPGPNKDTVQNHLCLLPDQLSIFIHYLFTLVLTLVILAIRAFVLTSKRTTSSSKCAHSASTQPLLPVSEISFLPTNTTGTSTRLKASSISSTSLPTLGQNQNQDSSSKHRLSTSSKPALSRSQSRSKSPSRLGGYGNLPPSSRSASPFKSHHQHDDFAPAPHVPVISSSGVDEDDWGMPSTDANRRPRSRRRGLVGEFVYSVWQVAWPAALFYAWVVWNG